MFNLNLNVLNLIQYLINTKYVLEVRKENWKKTINKNISKRLNIISNRTDLKEY